MPKKIPIISVPDMMMLWDEEENSEIDPATVGVGSNSIYAWKHIEMGHTFHASPRSIRHGHRCTICAGKEILPGFNDLPSQHPDICSEWDYSANPKAPEEYTVSSGKAVFWKCRFCGNRWSARINNRTKGSGCPRCSSSRQTSFPEQAIMYYAKSLFKSVLSQFRFNQKYTIDIFVKSRNIAIEYDGYAWHRTVKTRDRDREKNRFCQKNNIRLIRIKETKKNCIKKNTSTIYYYRDRNDQNLNKVIYILFHDYFGCTKTRPLDFDVIRDKNKIFKNYRMNLVTNSLATKRPDLAEEWDYKANYPLKPETVPYSSNTPVMWRCKKYGHSFEMSPDKRIQRGQNCPYCSNRKLLKGFNDFGTWCKQNNRDDLIKEWKDDRASSEFLMGNKKEIIQWKCKRCGHEWQATILSRAHGYNNCEECNARVKYQYVVKSDSSGNIISTYHSTNDAAKCSGLIGPLIADAIIDKSEYGGYLWSLKKDMETT